MLKVSIPLDAVKHKMSSDGVDSQICSTVVSEAENRPQRLLETTVAVSPPLNNVVLRGDVIEQLSRRVLQENATSQDTRGRRQAKMEKENVDRKIIDLVLGDDNVVASESASQTVLTVAEEKIASGYRKMLKMCIPQEAVHHKMQRDEVSQIIVAVLGQDKSEGPSNIANSRPGFHFFQKYFISYGRRRVARIHNTARCSSFRFRKTKCCNE
jgi:hypothetical protein